MRAIKLRLIFLVIGLLLFSNHIFSQWEQGQINIRFSFHPIALIDIEPSYNNSIHFSIMPSSESGTSPQIEESANETLWINYSSALRGSQNSRSIVAQISQGVLPEGISFSLEASQYNGLGGGQLGTSAGKTDITVEPKVIITNIGSCFTGNGINNGHSLNFSVNITDLSKISAIETTVFTILYTITDD